MRSKLIHGVFQNLKENKDNKATATIKPDPIVRRYELEVLANKRTLTDAEKQEAMDLNSRIVRF